MTTALGAALVAAFIAFHWLAGRRPSRRQPADDLSWSFNRGKAREMAVLRRCWDQRALQTRTARSISSVRR
ncbi:hypothetical protein [Kushneria konosiri]|uniref:Uncharacterized protein n=1 Tax=Kushneria konosiri TaxID=698828 RepID=A0A2Z2H929_9GAMM|nr:hypothetical protein [Kushneria konosiri]ARS51527.1 hypothetical protein B9G99_00270 [Kushneria konosiri]